MAIATINLFSVTDPAGGYLQETTSEKSVDIATCKDATGITKLAVPKGVVTKTKDTTSNDDWPQWEYSGTGYPGAT